MSSVNGESTAAPVWTNEFPQTISLWDWLAPGILFGFGTAFICSALISDSASLTATNVLFGIGIFLIGIPSVVKILEHRHPNSVQINDPGQCTIRTRKFHEPTTTGGLAVLFIAMGAFAMWHWDPYSFLPVQTEISNSKQSAMPFYGSVLLIIGVIVFGLRPWRRRLVFSPEGLAYRRFGPQVFIPWETIDSVTAHENNFLQTAIVTARPPAQLPALERKQLPDGSTRAKLAIYGMTVDPATVIYLIRNFAADPDVRQLLATSKYPERLFTGPSWDQRVAMEPSQTWPLPRLEDLAAG